MTRVSLPAPPGPSWRRRQRGPWVALVVLAVTAAGCAGHRVAYPAVGMLGAIPASPIVTQADARGSFKGVGFHVDATMGGHVDPFELTFGARIYSLIDYEGRCPLSNPPGCSGRPLTRNALAVMSIDLLAVRVRLLPWRESDVETRRFSLLATARFGIGFPAYLRRDLAGLYMNEEWGTRGTAAAPAVGVGVRYRLSDFVSIHLEADAAWFFFDPSAGTMTIIGVKIGPALRW